MTEPIADSIVIQQLHPGDEARLREVRLRSLRDSPDAFATTLEQNLQLPIESWHDQLQKLSTFVAVRGGEDVGLVRGAPSRDDPTVAWLLSMWVAPETRRRGIGAQLIEALLRWAEEAGFRSVRLDAGEENSEAISLYEREGFRRTGKTGALPPPRQHVHDIEMEVSLPRPR